jgi:hypothetical protein
MQKIIHSENEKCVYWVRGQIYPLKDKYAMIKGKIYVKNFNIM